MKQIKTSHAFKRRALVASLSLALTLGASHSIQAQSEITFNLKEADIQTVIGTVSEVTGQNFIIDPRVKGKVTVISSKSMTPDEVYQTFLSLLEVHNFAAVPVGNVIKVVPDVNAKQMGGQSVLSRPLNETDEVITRVIEVKSVSATQLVPILRPLIPQQGHMAAYAPTNVLIISDRAANLQRVMKIIERIDVASGSDIEVISLKHAAATEVVRILETLSRQQGVQPEGGTGKPTLVADERTNSILISGDKNERLAVRAVITHLDTPLETSGNTHVVYMRYAKAKDLVPVLTGLSETYEKEAGGGGAAAATPKSGRSPINIQAHEDTNSLVITGPQDLVRSLQGVIQKLDIRRAQVLVEAVIAEVKTDRSAQLGVSWFVDGTPGNQGPVAGTLFPGSSANAPAVAAALADGNVPNIPSGIGSFLGVGRFNSPNTDATAILTALAGDTETNVLSRPNILTLDNEEAEIVVGENVPFLTGSYTNTGSDGGSTPSNPFQTIKRENVGITLKVKPQINEGDAVKLDLEQKVDSISNSPITAADLITNTRSVKTSVLVDDGGTIVLGGLIRDNLIESEQKVPVLGDIPLLGALFRSKSSAKEKTNLMIFITPSIVRDPAMATNITSGKYNYIRAEQMRKREGGVFLMDDKESPVLPEFSDLPPPYMPGHADTQRGLPLEPVKREQDDAAQ